MYQFFKVAILIFCIVILIVELVAISYSDITKRQISNKSILFLAIVIIPYSILLNNQLYFIPALITLGIGFILFITRILGAGDVKMLSVLILAIPTSELMSFFFFTTLFGGILAVIGLIFFHKNVREKGLPYGVAIACGFILQNILFFSPALAQLK